MKFIRHLAFIILYFFIFNFIQIAGFVISFIIKLCFDSDSIKDIFLKFGSVGMSEEQLMEVVMDFINELIPLSLIVMGIFIIIFMIFYFRKPNVSFADNISFLNIAQIIAMGIVFNFIVSAVVSLLPQSLQQNHDQAVSYVTSSPLLILLISVGLMAPITEEFFFRFLMMNEFKDYKVLKVLIPAIVFGIAHGNLVQGMYAFALGLVLGFVFYFTDNLLYTILMHTSFNLFSVSELISLSLKSYIFYGAVPVLIICSLLLLFRKKKIA